jgi:hypothetical protein
LSRINSRGKWVSSVAVLVLLLAVTLNVTTAFAAISSAKEICEGYGGTWTGSSVNEVGGWCVGVTEGLWFDIYCEPDDVSFSFALIYYKEDPGPSSFWDVTNGICQSASSAPTHHTPAEPVRCRLISVDKPIYVGTTFQAEWRGSLNSLRLREPGASILFLSPVPGSVHWTSNNSRVGTFATSGVVDVGNYFASCFGNEGMVGAEVKTIVRR